MSNIVNEKMFDFEEVKSMMLEYRKLDPVGCAELCGRLIQARKDQKRIEEMEQTIATLQAQLQQKAG